VMLILLMLKLLFWGRGERILADSLAFGLGGGCPFLLPLIRSGVALLRIRRQAAADAGQAPRPDLCTQMEQEGRPAAERECGQDRDRVGR
jgi:hypothetical protein